MASSPIDLGGTPGARWFPSFDEVAAMIDEIAARHGLSWEDGEAPYADLIVAGEFTAGNVKRFTLQSIRAATIATVKVYREAPPPAPSRIARDFVDPAVKAASRLAAALENEHAKAVLASTFANYRDADQFVADLKRLATTEEIPKDDHAKMQVEKIADEFGITLLDPREHVLSTFGADALREYDAVDARLTELEHKHRTDPIRFQLAHDVVRAMLEAELSALAA